VACAFESVRHSSQFLGLLLLFILTLIILLTLGIHTATPLSEEDPRTGSLHLLDMVTPHINHLNSTSCLGRMDYFGPVTSHAHLVENAAHGGQIVISETTWEKCDNGQLLLPHSCASLGKYMFAKDDGIELFQVAPFFPTQNLQFLAKVLSFAFVIRFAFS
jgi:hypothetical protein